MRTSLMKSKNHNICPAFLRQTLYIGGLIAIFSTLLASTPTKVFADTFTVTGRIKTSQITTVDGVQLTNKYVNGAVAAFFDGEMEDDVIKNSHDYACAVSGRSTTSGGSPLSCENTDEGVGICVGGGSDCSGKYTVTTEGDLDDIRYLGFFCEGALVDLYKVRLGQETIRIDTTVNCPSLITPFGPPEQFDPVNPQGYLACSSDGYPVATEFMPGRMESTTFPIKFQVSDFAKGGVPDPYDGMPLGDEGDLPPDYPGIPFAGSTRLDAQGVVTKTNTSKSFWGSVVGGLSLSSSIRDPVLNEQDPNKNVPSCEELMCSKNPYAAEDCTTNSHLDTSTSGSLALPTDYKKMLENLKAKYGDVYVSDTLNTMPVCFDAADSDGIVYVSEVNFPGESDPSKKDSILYPVDYLYCVLKASTSDTPHTAYVAQGMQSDASRPAGGEFVYSDPEVKAVYKADFASQDPIKACLDWNGTDGSATDLLNTLALPEGAVTEEQRTKQLEELKNPMFWEIGILNEACSFNLLTDPKSEHPANDFTNPVSANTVSSPNYEDPMDMTLTSSPFDNKFWGKNVNPVVAIISNIFNFFYSLWGVNQSDFEPGGSCLPLQPVEKCDPNNALCVRKIFKRVHTFSCDQGSLSCSTQTRQCEANSPFSDGQCQLNGQYCELQITCTPNASGNCGGIAGCETNCAVMHSYCNTNTVCPNDPYCTDDCDVEPYSCNLNSSYACKNSLNGSDDGCSVNENTTDWAQIDDAGKLSQYCNGVNKTGEIFTENFPTSKVDYKCEYTQSTTYTVNPDPDPDVDDPCQRNLSGEVTMVADVKDPSPEYRNTDNYTLKIRNMTTALSIPDPANVVAGGGTITSAKMDYEHPRMADTKSIAFVEKNDPGGNSSNYFTAAVGDPNVDTDYTIANGIELSSNSPVGSPATGGLVYPPNMGPDHVGSGYDFTKVDPNEPSVSICDSVSSSPSSNVKPLDELLVAIPSSAYKPNVRRCYDYIVKRSIDTGNNPALIFAIWLEETGASNYQKYGRVYDFGCGLVPNNFSAQLECALSRKKAYQEDFNGRCLDIVAPNDKLNYLEFLRIYATGFSSCKNPPKNWADKLNGQFYKLINTSNARLDLNSTM